MSDSCSKCHYLVNDCICIEHRQCIAQLSRLHEQNVRLQAEVSELRGINEAWKEQDDKHLKYEGELMADNARFRQALEKIRDYNYRCEEMPYGYEICMVKIAREALSSVKPESETWCRTEERCGKCSECRKEGFTGPKVTRPEYLPERGEVKE